MSLEIEVSHNFFELEKFFASFNSKLNIPSLRFAINRAATTVKKEGINEVKKHLNIKTGNARKRVTISKARGGSKGTNFKGLEARVRFKGNPIPLLDFVVGSKQPRDQKGIAVSSRKGISVKITPGRKIKLRHAFIADVKSKQVFKREDAGRSALKKQSAPSIGAIVNSPKRRILPKLRSIAQRRFRTEFSREINRKLNGVRGNKRLRKA